MTLEDRFPLATRADAALSFTRKDWPWENFERVAIRFLDGCPFNFAMKEISLTVRALDIQYGIGLKFRS